MDKQALRELFPVTKNLVYFNHAAVGPMSVRACAAMEGHARDQRDFGALHWREWYAEHDRARRAGAALLGADAGEVAILKNTSEGIALVAEGYRWESGDSVVTTDLEFPSNSTPWRRLARRGVECRLVRSSGGAFTPEDVEKQMDAKTRIVTVSSVQFHNGFAADLEAIGEICARRGALFCVDAIQSVGALPIDVRRAKIAFLAADGHKWMCGPEGAALFFVSAEHRERLEVIESGWTNFERKGRFIDCPLDLLPSARRFEPGSLNTNGIYGLCAALDLLQEVGIEAIAAEVVRLATKLAEGLESIGFKLGAPKPVASGIVGVTPPPVDSARLRQFSGIDLPASPSAGAVLAALHTGLEKEGIVCAPREGMLRFSPHFYNDDAEVERVAEVLGKLKIAN
ncbi:MAG TPA: aminotransferase class V-fold PLP-dependent enzyme [Thermoanaerobaculia bacterium]|nr:aminotransferase class V-fold PLP-dependent enzyme [Thermoanaerobaculia bacterium]